MRENLGPLIVLSVSLVAVPAFAAEVVVQVGHSRLNPAAISIAVGDIVTFHSLHAMQGGHTIVAADGSFKSPPLAKDEKWSHTFTAAGSYTCYAEEHPAAKVTVIVN